MQATVKTTLPAGKGFGRMSTSLKAFTIAAGIAVSVVGLVVADAVPGMSDDRQAMALPQARASISQGEGRLGGHDIVVTSYQAPVTAHFVEGMGEGLLATGRVVAPVKAHSAIGQGEGILGGYTSVRELGPAITAHFEAGMGEGWVGQGRPADARDTAAE